MGKHRIDNRTTPDYSVLRGRVSDEGAYSHIAPKYKTSDLILAVDLVEGLIQHTPALRTPPRSVLQHPWMSMDILAHSLT